MGLSFSVRIVALGGAEVCTWEAGEQERVWPMGGFPACPTAREASRSAQQSLLSPPPVTLLPNPISLSLRLANEPVPLPAAKFIFKESLFDKTKKKSWLFKFGGFL